MLRVRKKITKGKYNRSTDLLSPQRLQQGQSSNTVLSKTSEKILASSIHLLKTDFAVNIYYIYIY